MASISKRKGGQWSIRFMDKQNRRRTLALGSTSKGQATNFKLKLESLLWAVNNGVVPAPETMDWLNKLGVATQRKLAAFGLVQVQGEGPQDVTLGKFLDAVFKSRTGSVKASTMIVWVHARRNLEAFFGKERTLVSITPGDAADYERYMKTNARKHQRKKGAKAVGKEASEEGAKEEAKLETLKSSTIRKRISIAKLFFNDAVEREILDRNPFAKLKSATRANRDRDFFVTAEMTAKVLEAAPDAEWRAIIALARYGGLRTPSETFALRWGDIDWANNRMTIHSPKTEHHEGKATRLTPIFPELLPYLEDAHAIAPEGTEFVINRYRNPSQNIGTQFKRIIGRAGLPPWPKLFQNLRASRATELAETFPGHVAAAWLGHSEKIADKHYRQVTEEHFQQATGDNPARSTNVATRGAQGRIAEGDVSAELLSMSSSAQGGSETVASHRFEL